MDRIILLDQYQKKATTDLPIYPNQGTFVGLLYTVLGLNGEAGEVAEKIKKVMRDDDGVISEEVRLGLKKELGDVFWYLANVAAELEFSLSDIANDNIEKLISRAQRGVIKGNGDKR